MNTTMRRLLGRSVQLTVLATPSSSLADAIAEARRRHAAAAGWLAKAATPAPRATPLPA
jgi:hypothetical protein